MNIITTTTTTFVIIICYISDLDSFERNNIPTRAHATLKRIVSYFFQKMV